LVELVLVEFSGIAIPTVKILAVSLLLPTIAAISPSACVAN
jgi:hypothetical protein